MAKWHPYQKSWVSKKEWQARQRDPKRKGYVYIFSLGQGLYKIGKTTDPNKRIQSLKTGNPDIETICAEYVSDRHAMERTIQGRFSRRRHSRETFLLSDSDLVRAKEMLRKVAILPTQETATDDDEL